MKKTIETGAYELKERSYAEVSIDEFIDVLKSHKEKGATHFILSSSGHDDFLNDIDFYYERDMTADEIADQEKREEEYKKWCKENDISRTIKVIYNQPISLLPK